MSIVNVIRGSLTLAFALTVAGGAFARQPPALVAAQEAAERATNQRSAPGYRDAYARLPNSRVDGTRYVATGYRDSLVRSPAAPGAGAQRQLCRGNAYGGVTC